MLHLRFVLILHRLEHRVEDLARQRIALAGQRRLRGAASKNKSITTL